MVIREKLQKLQRSVITWQRKALVGLRLCRPMLTDGGNKALTGVVVAIPLIATGFVVKQAYIIVNDFSAPFLGSVGIHWPLLPFFVTLGVLTALGYMASNMLGQRILDGMERILLRIPVVTTIYAGVKQVIDSFKSFNNMGNFKRVVYVDYPSDGARLIGFVTGQYYDANLREEMTSVVIPTAPNPMTGLIIVVPNNKLTDSSLTLEEAMKMVVSAGLVVPKRRPIVVPPVPARESALAAPQLAEK
jgi:uncharacterized membrane protein